MSQGGVIWCLPTHTHTMARDGDMRLCCALRVKSRISWRLFIMHKVPSGMEHGDNFPPIRGPNKIIDSICKLAQKPHTQIAIRVRLYSSGRTISTLLKN